MGWLVNGVKEAIWGWVLDLASDIMSKAFGLITDMVIKTSNINAYFNISQYLLYVQIVAGSLLVLAVVWESFKQLSGQMIPTERKSIGVLMLQTVYAGLLIYFLPWSVINILLPINAAFINLIQSIGVKFDTTKIMAAMPIGDGIEKLGALMIIMILVMSVAFLILGIAGGIRYINLLVILLFGPIAAISAVKNGEAIQVWVRETIAVVFTQTLHVLLLQVLLVIIANVQGVMMFVLSIGAITVMLQGPQVIRKFLYTSGVGSASVASVGGAGRMAAMKFMFKPIKA